MDETLPSYFLKGNSADLAIQTNEKKKKEPIMDGGRTAESLLLDGLKKK